MKKAATFLASGLFLASTTGVSLANATHKVRKGESLSCIALRYHVRVDAIMRVNGLSSDEISAGDRLTIPGVSPRGKAALPASREASATGDRGSAPGRAAPAPAAPAEGNGAEDPAASRKEKRHVVRKGETLASIARRYGVGVGELKAQNGIRNARRLAPGTRLIVRREEAREYVVRDGDNLWKIARTHGRTVDELVEINGLASTDLAPGQELRLDPEGAPADPSPAAAERAAEIEKAVREIAGPAPEGPEEKEGNGNPEGLKDRLIAIARKMIDIPYRFGGNTMLGIDCSGYVRKVFSFLRIELPRSAREQFGIGEEVGKGDLEQGDLVFFRTRALSPSHVGIYLGNGEFIHASSKERRVKIDSLDAPYYVKRFLGARRVIDAPPESGEM